MKNRDATAYVGFTYEPDSNPNVAYDFRVMGVVERYDPGDYDTPPCGGGCEITNASLEKVHNFVDLPDGEAVIEETHSALLEPNREAIEAEFLVWLAAPEQATERARLEGMIAEAADDADEAAKEEAAERRAEWRREREEGLV